jgi:hypothetical protein
MKQTASIVLFAGSTLRGKNWMCIYINIWRYIAKDTNVNIFLMAEKIFLGG